MKSEKQRTGGGVVGDGHARQGSGEERTWAVAGRSPLSRLPSHRRELGGAVHARAAGWPGLGTHTAGRESGGDRTWAERWPGGHAHGGAGERRGSHLGGGRAVSPLPSPVLPFTEGSWTRT